MNIDRRLPWDWFDGAVPENVTVGEDAYIETAFSFTGCRSTEREAIVLGRAAGIYKGVMFDLGPKARVTIGDFALLNGGPIVCDAAIEIGDYCLLSWNVVLMDTYRWPADPAKRRQLLHGGVTPPRLDSQTQARPIRIGRNVWIGFDTCVLPGVTIGEGSIVGSRSVVLDDVPAYTLAAGNPARVIRALDPGIRERTT